MILNSKIDAEKDDIICFDFDDENDDTYIKFISQELDKSGNYKVRYTNPNPDEIFTELDIHQGEQEINMEENFHLNDEETIKKSVLNSEFVEEYAAAVAYTYGFGSGWADFWKSAASNFPLVLMIVNSISKLSSHSYMSLMRQNGLCSLL